MSCYFSIMSAGASPLTGMEQKAQFFFDELPEERLSTTSSPPAGRGNDYNTLKYAAARSQN